MKLYLWYHGTNEENCNSILKTGFNKYTHFTPSFNSAMTMGGPYIFGVLLSLDPKESYWQWVSDEVIPITSIHSIVHIKDVEVLYHNPKLNHMLRWGEEKAFCEKCKGSGDTNYPHDGHHLLPGGSRFDNNTHEVIICTECQGYGCK